MTSNLEVNNAAVTLLSMQGKHLQLIEPFVIIDCLLHLNINVIAKIPHNVWYHLLYQISIMSPEQKIAFYTPYFYKWQNIHECNMNDTITICVVISAFTYLQEPMKVPIEIVSTMERMNYWSESKTYEFKGFQ